MKKHDVIKAVSASTGLSIADAMMAVQSLTAVIIERVTTGDRVEIDGFGIFEVRNWLSREGRNPATGEHIHIGERMRVVFRADDKLICAIREEGTMGEKKKRQEICEGQYDEFLGHPDIIEDVKRGVNDHKYPVLSGNEGMHDVVKYTDHLIARAENAPATQSTAAKQKKDVRRAERSDRLDEVLVHPDYTEESERDECAARFSEIHGTESLQNGDEQGWH